MTVSFHPDIVFATVPGYRPLALDLYVGDAPRALCVYLHGGGWRRGSRRDGPGHMNGPGRHYFHRMAERGLAVAAVDYRLSGEAIFPAQLDDVAAACAFVRERLGGEGLGGRELGSEGLAGDRPVDHGLGDLPLTLWGLSAGAHLAAMTALTSPVAGLISAATCWSAPSDLVLHQADVEAVGGDVDRGPDSREALFLGGPVHELADLARSASPIHQVGPAGARFELVHGTADVHVPHAQSERFAHALDDAGTPVRLVSVDGADHFYTTIERERLDQLVDDSIGFLLAD